MSDRPQALSACLVVMVAAAMVLSGCAMARLRTDPSAVQDQGPLGGGISLAERTVPSTLGTE